MKDCPCGLPLEVKTVINLNFHCEAEVLTCVCGRIREHYEVDQQRANFIQYTHKLMGIDMAATCKLNETSTDKFKALADSL